MASRQLAESCKLLSAYENPSDQWVETLLTHCKSRSYLQSFSLKTYWVSHFFYLYTQLIMGFFIFHRLGFLYYLECCYLCSCFLSCCRDGCRIEADISWIFDIPSFFSCSCIASGLLCVFFSAALLFAVLCSGTSFSKLLWRYAAPLVIVLFQALMWEQTMTKSRHASWGNPTLFRTCVFVPDRRKDLFSLEIITFKNS